MNNISGNGLKICKGMKENLKDLIEYVEEIEVVLDEIKDFEIDAANVWASDARDGLWKISCILERKGFKDRIYMIDQRKRQLFANCFIARDGIKIIL